MCQLQCWADGRSVPGACLHGACQLGGETDAEQVIVPVINQQSLGHATAPIPESSRVPQGYGTKSGLLSTARRPCGIGPQSRSWQLS